MKKKLLKIFHRPNFQVGDVVEYFKNKYIIKDFRNNGYAINEHGSPMKIKLMKLIQPNVTLSDVLVKFQEIRKFHTTLEISNKGYLTYWESTDPDKTKQVDWVLKKDGKTLGLWEQSESIQKFIQEILE